MCAAPDQADEERTKAGEAGTDDCHGRFGRGPGRCGYVVPGDIRLIHAGENSKSNNAHDADTVEILVLILSFCSVVLTLTRQ